MKDKKLIFTIVGILFMSILVIGVVIKTVGNNNSSLSNATKNYSILEKKEITDIKNIINTKYNNETPLVSEDGVNLIMTEKNINEIEKTANSFHGLEIDKMIDLSDITDGLLERKTIENKTLFLYWDHNNNFCAAVDQEQISKDPDIDDWANSAKDIIKRNEIDMKENFGIDISDFENNISNYDILLKIAEYYKIDTSSLIGMPLDKEVYDTVYKTYGQKKYYADLMPDFDYSILEITDDDYDEIIDTYANFTTETQDGTEYPAFIDINVFYTKNGRLYWKVMEFSMMWY